MKFLFRIFGYGFVAVAIIAGIADASSSIALSEIRLAQLGQVWQDLSPTSFEMAEVHVVASFDPTVWQTLKETVLTWPVWAVFAPIGLLLLWLGAKRRRQRVLYA
ncbi:hypothetical protein [Roseibium sp. LAB1]